MTAVTSPTRAVATPVQDAPALAPDILAGKIRGRVVLEVP